MPYLRRIDAARTYTNWGPLLDELETRLARHFGIEREQFVSASSATAALVGAIFATAGRASGKRNRALMPSYTFIATASAAEQCGYVPLLADIEESTWALDPDAIAKHPLLDEVGVVIPVAPFGRTVPQQAWQSFRDRTGIPVVIDAAASFEAVEREPRDCIGALPVALSFHATKSFGCGEGGAVLCTDKKVVAESLRALNFGFLEARDSRGPNINGKLSEYHAAVGLAELDGWSAKRESLMQVAHRYRDGFTAAKLSEQFVGAPDVASCYSFFVARDADQSRRIQAAFTQEQIGFRFWYGQGLHSQTYLRNRPHGPLPVTDDIAGRVIGLPVAVDLAPAAIDRVIDVVATAARN